MSAQHDSRYDIHGVVVALDAESAAGPAGVLVGAFPRVDAAPMIAVRGASNVVPRREDLRARGFAPAFFHGYVQAWEREGVFVYEDGRSGALLEAGARSLVLDLAGPSEEAYFVVLPAILHALRVQGLFEIHAAAVEAEGSSILIAGESGVGKSTLSIVLASNGARLVNDDTVLLRKVASAIEILSFRTHVQLSDRTLGALPALAPHASARSFGVTPKRAIDPRILGGFLPALPRVDALIFPEIHDAEETKVRSLSQSEAFGHLLRLGAPWLRAPAPRHHELHALFFELATRARAYEASLGRDVLADPSAFAQRFLRMLSEAAS